MSLYGRLAAPSILLCLTLLTACENFTLIGSVNLGGPEEPHGEQDAGSEADSGAGPIEDAACWPDKTAMASELRQHGYHYLKPEWAETAKWFAALEPVKEGLPACP